MFLICQNRSEKANTVYLPPGPTEHVPAMEKVKQLVAEAGLEGRAFARSER